MTNFLVLFQRFRWLIYWINPFQSALDAFEETLSKFSNGTFGNQTEEEKMEAVFQATYTFEQFVLEYAQYHLNKTTPNLSINSQEIGKGKKKKRKIIYYL